VSCRTVLYQSNAIRKVKLGVLWFFISDEEHSTSDEVMENMTTKDF